MEMDAKSIFISIVVVGIVALLGTLIFSRLYLNTRDTVPYTNTTVTDRAVTARLLTNVAMTSNADCTDGAECQVACEEAYNATSTVNNLTEGGNYTCSDLGFQLLSEEWDNLSVNVSYFFGADTATHDSLDSVSGTFLDAETLGIVGLVVLAGVFMLLVIMKLE